MEVCLAVSYLLLAECEVGEGSTTESMHMARVLPENGTEIKDGRLTLAQQGITPGSFQQ